MQRIVTIFSPPLLSLLIRVLLLFLPTSFLLLTETIIRITSTHLSHQMKTRIMNPVCNINRTCVAHVMMTSIGTTHHCSPSSAINTFCQPHHKKNLNPTLLCNSSDISVVHATAWGRRYSVSAANGVRFGVRLTKLLVKKMKEFSPTRLSVGKLHLHV